MTGWESLLKNNLIADFNPENVGVKNEKLKVFLK